MTGKASLADLTKLDDMANADPEIQYIVETVYHLSRKRLAAPLAVNGGKEIGVGKISVAAVLNTTNLLLKDFFKLILSLRKLSKV